MQSLKELETNLATYNEQLHQVRQLLEAAPGNAEYQEMASALEEVIELTYDLLKTAKQAEASNVVLLETDFDSPSLPKSQGDPPVSRFRPQQVCISHML
jgi:survival-of-motor-neuron-related-splicing factor 30